MVTVVVNLVVVDGQEVAVVVGVKAVRRVVVHLVSSPVSLLVTIRVHSEMIVVDVRVVDVAVDVDRVEKLRIAQVLAESAHLIRMGEMWDIFDKYLKCWARHGHSTRGGLKALARVMFHPARA